MVKNHNEHLNQPDADQPENQNPETQKYNEARSEAINEAKKLEHALVHELEAHETHREKKETLEAMRQSDAPKISPENNVPEENQLEAMFREIKTDDAVYEYSRTISPRFTQTCESSRLGQNFPRDILGLALGVGDSLLSIVKLGGDVVVDAAKFAVHPIKSYRDTKEILENNVA